MRSYGGDKYIFSYLDSDSSQVLKINYADDKYVGVETGRQLEEFTGRDVIKVPVYERVAAGNAQLMDEQVADYFSLPAKWFNNKSKLFLLKVKGDSMINAGINDNDLVLIEKKNTAQNKEIVIVSQGDDAVIKRYFKEGSTVMLLSENSKYAPIHVRTELARILGVAFAVIRGK